MDTQPEIVKLAPSLNCSYCLGRNRGRRAANYTVDGTSVCNDHLSEAIEYYRYVRARALAR